MALLFADDFQQMKKNSSNPSNLGSAGFSYVPTFAAGIAAAGFDLPNTRYNGNLYSSVNYDDVLNCLIVQYTLGDIYTAGAQGLSRTLKYSGDTLFYNLNFLINTTQYAVIQLVGQILAIGSDVLSLLANGNYALNGTDTGQQAVFTGAPVLQYIELVITKTDVSFYFSNTLILKQTRSITNMPTTSLLGVQNSNTGLQVYSLIIADNADGNIKTRIGRKVAKSVSIDSIKSQSATLEPATGVTAVSALNRLTQDLYADTGGLLLGNIYSSVEYSKNTFTGAKPAGSSPRGVVANVQMKRRSPAGDGMTAVPYILYNGAEIPGKAYVPTSTWKSFSIELPIVLGAPDFTTFDFGYTIDYANVDKLFISNTDGVAVYGSD